MESVERKRVGGRVLRGWGWASPTVQLGLLQEVVLQVGSQPEENSLWCKQTVYIEAFLWKQRLMFGAICTFSVCSAASWEISRCWAPSIFSWNTGSQGQSERFPRCTIWAAGHQQARSWSIIICVDSWNLHRVVQLQLPLLQERVVLFSVTSSQRCGEKNISLEDHCGTWKN